MLSPLLALFIRSLREDSRQNLTYFARSGLVLVILLFLFTTQSRMGWDNAPGLKFFSIVAYIDLFAILLTGVGYFSAAVSEEKEDMTLGLLRMTNLNPLSILLGKSTSRLCSAILLLAAQLPFTLLAITLGGISLHQILAAYAAIGSFLVFMSNLALLGSVLCRRTAGAAVFTGLALFLFFAFPALLTGIAAAAVQLGWATSGSGTVAQLDVLANTLYQVSPFISLDAIFRSGFVADAFSVQVWTHLALGLLFFLIAWAVFDLFCNEQREAGSARKTTATGRRRWRFLAPPRPGKWALSWKDFYFASGGKLWLLIKFLVYGVPLLVIRCWPRQFDDKPSWEMFGVGVCFFMAAFIVVEMAFAAANVFRIERQGKTLSSLAMLPMDMSQIAYEKMLGFLPSLSAAGIYILLALPLTAKLIGEGMGNIDGWGIVIFLMCVTQGLFFLHLIANLSLRVNRGALPLAIGVHFLLMMLVSIGSFGLFDGEAGVVVLLFLTTGAIMFLHVDTGRRLVQLAAEDS